MLSSWEQAPTCDDARLVSESAFRKGRKTMSDTTVGQILTDKAERDAIHMAIAPVMAGERLTPGDHVALDSGMAVAKPADTIGIVDPFLKSCVEAGQRFYLFLYPKTVTGMRHHWNHPAFTGADRQATPEEVRMRQSKLVVSEIAKECGVTYARLIDALQNDEYINMGSNQDYRDIITGSTEEALRHHAEIILGRKIKTTQPFSCAC